LLSKIQHRTYHSLFPFFHLHFSDMISVCCLQRVCDPASVCCDSRSEYVVLLCFAVGLSFKVSVDANRLTLSNVKKSDTQMVQCNASNVHGYLLSNAYLNVQGNNRVWTAVVRNKLITRYCLQYKFTVHTYSMLLNIVDHLIL